MTMRSAVVAVAVCVAGGPLYAQWPQWRGPGGRGIST